MIEWSLKFPSACDNLKMCEVTKQRKHHSIRHGGEAPVGNITSMNLDISERACWTGTPEKGWNDECSIVKKMGLRRSERYEFRWVRSLPRRAQCPDSQLQRHREPQLHQAAVDSIETARTVRRHGWGVALARNDPALLFELACFLKYKNDWWGGPSQVLTIA